MGGWRNLVSELFIPLCFFLASANACKTLFPLVDLDIKAMSIL